MKPKLETIVLLTLVGAALVVAIIMPAIKAQASKAQAWTGAIDVAGPPEFQRYVRLALIEAENAGYGRFIALNIARIQPEGPAYWDVGGHITPNTDGARGTAYVQPAYTPQTDWLWPTLLELAVHQSQVNNGHPSCGRMAEYTAAWVRQVAAESAGGGAGIDSEKPLRTWDSIPEIGGCP